MQWNKISLIILSSVLLVACNTQRNVEKPLPQVPPIKQPGYEFSRYQLILHYVPGYAKQRLYVFKNISKGQVSIDQPVLNTTGGSGDWSIDLPSRHMAVYTTDKTDIVLTCYKKQSGEVAYFSGKFNSDDTRFLSCQQVLQVSWIKKPQFTPGVTGSFWVVEDELDPMQALYQARLRGINWVMPPPADG